MTQAQTYRLDVRSFFQVQISTRHFRFLCHNLFTLLIDMKYSSMLHHITFTNRTQRCVAGAHVYFPSAQFTKFCIGDDLELKSIPLRATKRVTLYSHTLMISFHLHRRSPVSSSFQLLPSRKKLLFLRASSNKIQSLKLR